MWHADAIPICIRLLNNKEFQPGPFYLGSLGLVIGWIAVAWVVFITAVFVMPLVFPVTRGEHPVLSCGANSNSLITNAFLPSPILLLSNTDGAMIASHKPQMYWSYCMNTATFRAALACHASLLPDQCHACGRDWT